MRRTTLGPGQTGKSSTGVVSRSNSKNRTILMDEKDGGRAQPTVIITKQKDSSIDSYGRRYNQTTTKKAQFASGTRRREFDDGMGKMP